MPDDQHGVDEQHAGAAPAHNGADLLTHFGLVAVYFAGGAKGFGFHKGAAFNALQGVIMQGLALRAQAAFRRMVVFAAVQGDHLADQQLFAVPLFCNRLFCHQLTLPLSTEWRRGQMKAVFC